MPELPEVEVVRRSLQSFIKGLKIKKVSVFNRNLRYKIKSNFERIIEHQKIIFVKRRSKFLLLGLENNFIILIHLGMTGKMFISKEKFKKILKTSFYFESKMNKKHILLISILIIVLLNSCNEYQKILKSSNLDFKFDKAVELFQNEEYLKAFPLFDELLLAQNEISLDL